MASNDWTALQALHTDLRNEHRLKVNLDYAVTTKYGEHHLLCAEVYKETIVEVAQARGIQFKDIFTY